MHLRFLPSQGFEVMVDRRHFENSFFAQLVAAHLRRITLIISTTNMPAMKIRRISSLDQHRDHAHRPTKR